ncbi:unnamed protein product [Oikopleura dioica]|uniref:Uncharacterized protein n=1 Tax=Oikopleura dioica TaxID=34765 RepID=E4XZC9_OIKDI|nr:unnamed protein product [Oikopleura dioica]CBY15087.1 unnamed protein product [Oikopleura dioica]
MKIFAAFSAVALAQDMRMMSSHERLDSVSENIEIWIETYISNHNRVNKYKEQFGNLISYISSKLDMKCAGENQEEVEELAADDAIAELDAESEIRKRMKILNRVHRVHLLDCNRPVKAQRRINKLTKKFLGALAKSQN